MTWKAPGTRNRSMFKPPRVLQGTGPSSHCYFCIMVFYGEDRVEKRNEHERLNHSHLLRTPPPTPTKRNDNGG